LRVGGAAQPRAHHRDVTLGTVQRHLWCGQNLSQNEKIVVSDDISDICVNLCASTAQPGAQASWCQELQ
jgi:hypothetical protein